MNQISKLSFKLFLIASLALTVIPSVRAEDNDLQIAMDNYRKHDWEEALSHLGAALPSEFNNANLHYHMANCMVHMRQKESAIREYRIAYALDPHGRIGNYSKQCLKLFGIDAAGFLPMPEAPQKLEKGKDVETLAKKDSAETKDSKDAKDSKDPKDAKDSKDPSLAKVAKRDQVLPNYKKLEQTSLFAITKTLCIPINLLQIRNKSQVIKHQLPHLILP
jgi:tetratricopeptide (TPR) repeat protein